MCHCFATAANRSFHKPNLQCTRCGAHNKVGAAERYKGPEDPKYAEEWKQEQTCPKEHAPEDQDLREEVDPERTPRELLGRGAMTGLLASEIAQGPPI
jgi:hypothetical protein